MTGDIWRSASKPSALIDDGEPGILPGFSGIPGNYAPTVLRMSEASAQNASIVRITESGTGIRKRLQLGLNKALVIDLPEDAHDILVADPSLADAVTRTSRRIYLFGKTVGQTNIFILAPMARRLSASISKSNAILPALKPISVVSSPNPTSRWKSFPTTSCYLARCALLRIRPVPFSLPKPS